MAAVDISAVVSLFEKARELELKGHYARALEKWAAAVSTAEALQASRDCLIVATLQLRQGNAEKAAARSLPPEASKEAAVRTIMIFHAAAVAVLRRREVGTLLAGDIHPWEVAFAEACIRERTARATQEELQRAGAAVDMARWAQSLGYEALLRCAANAVSFFSCFHLHPDAELHACTVPALEAMLAAVAAQQMTRDHGCLLSAELELCASLTKHFDNRRRAAAAGAAPSIQHAAADSAFNAEVLPLWQALLRMRPGGTLYGGGAEFQAFVSNQAANTLEKCKASVEAAAASSARRCCAAAGCAAREAHPAHFKSCAACRAVVYCCREHQVADWPGHKKACKAARKAAAATEEAGGAGPTVAV